MAFNTNDDEKVNRKLHSTSILLVQQQDDEKHYVEIGINHNDAKSYCVITGDQSGEDVLRKRIYDTTQMTYAAATIEVLVKHRNNMNTLKI